MLSRSALPPWLRRPAGLAALSVLVLAALLSTGAVVARAVDGTPVADTTTPTASPSDSSGGNGTDNVAAGVNTKDGRSVYAIRLKIVQTGADTVDATNAAVAVSSCTDCTTVAIAFEGVLVYGSPSTFDPTNLALAANVDCAGCTTFADAYQQVVQNSTRVRITAAGRRAVAAIRQDLKDLRQADLPLDQVITRVKADEAAFADVLRNEIVPVGHDKDSAVPAGAPDVSDDPSATPAAQPATPTPASSEPRTAEPTVPDAPPTATATAAPSPTSTS